METTPPHLPTFKVRLSSATVNAIVAFVFPHSTLTSLRQLESGKSYNNRIYFLETESESESSLVSSDQVNSTGSQKLVLKLSGHYFGPNKVQNEIGALLLLQKYCPTIPVPRLLAWSEDGKTIETVDGRTTDADRDHIGARSQHGWVLMTRLPGRIPTQTDLTGISGQYVMRQLAEYMAEWRTSLPGTSAIGNVRFRNASDDIDPSKSVNLLKDNGRDVLSRFTIGGLILWHQYSPTPLFTPFDYYTYLARDQLLHLQRLPRLKPLLDKIGARVGSLISQLRLLSFLDSGLHGDSPSKFTHLDFSPRNILVSEAESASDPNLLQVTGLIDFEFAAFLPYGEEFLNMHIRQSDDWTQEQYEMLIAELVRVGCEVPHLPGRHSDPVCTKLSTGGCVCDSNAFEGLSILVQVIDNIAPWFIQDGAHDDVELERQCNLAAEAVLSGIAKLEPFFTT